MIGLKRFRENCAPQMNYYNENDKFAAKWLRELIKAELIPDGEVDDRSIIEVEPQDLKGYIQCHFFAGIGGWSRALELSGWHAGRPVWTGSLPCQPFSVAGKQKGKQDERHLWPVFYELVKECRPPVIFGEQVQSKDGREWLDGKEKIMQSMLDREAVVRVLQIFNAFGELPANMQSLLQGGGEKEKIKDSKGRKIKTVQGTSVEKQGATLSEGGEISRKKEGVGFLFGQTYRPPSRCHRCGRLRTDRDTFQSVRRKNLGLSKHRQGGLFEGVYTDQCTCGALLRKCDGESLGGKQDNRDIQCHNGNSALSLRGVTEQIRICFEATDRHRMFSGVRIDLEALGYRVGTSDLPACSVSAPHKRNRLFWVGNAIEERFSRSGKSRQLHEPIRGEGDNVPLSSSESGLCGRLANSELARREKTWKRYEQPAGNEFEQGLSEMGFWSDSAFIQCADGKSRRVPVRVAKPQQPGTGNNERTITDEKRKGLETGSKSIRQRDGEIMPSRDVTRSEGTIPEIKYEIEPALFPLADGIPNRVGLLKGAGNSITPQVAAEFIQAYCEI